jgi:hypothetical protein
MIKNSSVGRKIKSRRDSVSGIMIALFNDDADAGLVEARNLRSEKEGSLHVWCIAVPKVTS